MDANPTASTARKAKRRRKVRSTAPSDRKEKFYTGGE
jgi:hypothetical protein